MSITSLRPLPIHGPCPPKSPTLFYQNADRAHPLSVLSVAVNTFNGLKKMLVILSSHESVMEWVRREGMSRPWLCGLRHLIPTSSWEWMRHYTSASSPLAKWPDNGEFDLSFWTSAWAHVHYPDCESVYFLPEGVYDTMVEEWRKWATGQVVAMMEDVGSRLWLVKEGDDA
jgi:hypothetical protein